MQIESPEHGLLTVSRYCCAHADGVDEVFGNGGASGNTSSRHSFEHLSDALRRRVRILLLVDGEELSYDIRLAGNRGPNVREGTATVFQGQQKRSLGCRVYVFLPMANLMLFGGKAGGVLPVTAMTMLCEGGLKIKLGRMT